MTTAQIARAARKEQQLIAQHRSPRLHPVLPRRGGEMSSNLDLYRDDPRRLAAKWREAAEASRQQFPGNEVRYRYYVQKAEELERSAA